MNNFRGRTAVITGAASGFGLETSRIAAGFGMNIVMADVQQDALDRAVPEIEALGAAVLPYRLDVARAAEVEAMGRATFERFGAPHFVFNNAGVGAGGLIWEHTLADWEWVVGVNLMGVAHGVRVFAPMMLEAATKDHAYEGHITNTASMAGVLNMPNMGVYNVTKHAVVSLSETLYQDLGLVTDQIHASVLCPFFVPTGIHASERNRPAALRDASGTPTRSQRIARAMTDEGRGQRPHDRRGRRRARVRGRARAALLRLQPSAGAGRRAHADGRHRRRAQPDRPLRRPSRDRREAAGRSARGAVGAVIRRRVGTMRALCPPLCRLECHRPPIACSVLARLLP